ncbi:MAG: DUF4112 domain-containing protein [Gammaproteobacteria bacterium]
MKIKNHDANRSRLDRLAWLLDSSIPLPGTNFRVGLDGLIGLIPGVGDALGGVISSYIIAEAARMGVPKAILIRMAFNVILETIIGMIPVIGDLFDFAWKANNRNVGLLRAHLGDPRRTSTRSLVFVIVLGAVLLAVIVGIIALGVMLIAALAQALSN